MRSGWTSQKKNEPVRDVPPPQPAASDSLPGEGPIDVTTQERPAPALAPHRYTFPRLTRHGDLAAITCDDGTTLWYRSFVSITALVATLVTAFVSLCGMAAVIYLLIDGRFGAAILCLLVTTGFELIIPLLIPPVDVRFFSDRSLNTRAMEVTQIGRPLLPSDRFSVKDGDGRELGRVERSALSRLTRHRWSIFDDALRARGETIEESTGRALIRKITGRFRPDLDSDLVLTIDDRPAGRLVRRDAGDRVLLDLSRRVEGLDERVLVAMAALVFGLEP
jgi:hypothetical protein